MKVVIETSCTPTPWNKGKLVGLKAPLCLRDIWAIRIRLQLAKKDERSALFNLVTVFLRAQLTSTHLWPHSFTVFRERL